MWCMNTILEYYSSRGIEMNEKQIQAQIIKYIQAKGGYVVKVITATKAGVPDIIACIDGKFYGIEVKDPNGAATPLQLANLEMIRTAGGVGILARSVEDVMPG